MSVPVMGQSIHFPLFFPAPAIVRRFLQMLRLCGGESVCACEGRQQAEKLQSVAAGTRVRLAAAALGLPV